MYGDFFFTSFLHEENHTLFRNVYYVLHPVITWLQTSKSSDQRVQPGTWQLLERHRNPSSGTHRRQNISLLHIEAKRQVVRLTNILSR